MDLDDCVESWNTQLEDLLEVPRGEALAASSRTCFRAIWRGKSAPAASDHVSGIYKFHLNTRSNRHLVVNVSIAPLVAKIGERLGRLILLDDITQRMRLEEQMVQTEKLTSLGLLAAGVAHEVNTPLAVISNYIQMLAKQIPEDDPRQKTIENIVKQTFRASEIVNNLLNFSRTGGTESAEVNLNSVVEETLTLVRTRSRPRRCRSSRSYAERLAGNARLDHAAAAGVPESFHERARRHARRRHARGPHRHSQRLGGNRSHRHRRWHSRGTSAPHLRSFFTTKATGRGTGLGLSVSYGIIKEHAGKVDVRSTPGKGTSFRLEFPVARKAVHV